MTSLSKGKEPAGYYPTQWSDWEWDETSRGWRRYRLRAPEDYEIESERDKSSPVPRYLPPISETPVTYTSAPALSISAGMNDLTRGFQQTTISPSSDFQQEASFQSPNLLIRTKDIRTNEERFDPNYKVHGQWEFQWGRVFKILWAEPKGNGGNGDDSDAEISIREGKHGERHYEKVRRFLIVKQMDGHCICLPINTYSRQGTMKKGVHACHHTIIYTDKKPQYFPGEKERGLTRPPIQMTPNDPRHKLLKGSRLNYAKTYTVEYNVKVWFIGRIHRDFEAHVAAGYNDVHPPMQAPHPASTIPYDSASTTSYAGGATSSYAPYDQYPQSNLPGYTTTPSPPSSSPQTTLLPLSVPGAVPGYTPEPSRSDPEENTPRSGEHASSYEAGITNYGSGGQYMPQSGNNYGNRGESSSQSATQPIYQPTRYSSQSGGQSSRDTGSRSHHSSSSRHKNKDYEDDPRYKQKKRN